MGKAQRPCAGDGGVRLTPVQAHCLVKHPSSLRVACSPLKGAAPGAGEAGPSTPTGEIPPCMRPESSNQHEPRNRLCRAAGGRPPRGGSELHGATEVKSVGASHSRLSSWIFRVMVLRPMPSFWAASMRRPRVLASAVWISLDSNRRVSTSHTSLRPVASRARASASRPLSQLCSRPAAAGAANRLLAHARAPCRHCPQRRFATGFRLCLPMPGFPRAQGSCPALRAASLWALSPGPAPSR
jgi:hypothetical protein